MNMMNTKDLASAMATTLRSPLPWSVREQTPYPAAIVSGQKLITEFHLWDGATEERVRNIVKACNIHFHFAEVLRDIARQSIGEDWTPSQAMRFVARSVRLVLDKYNRVDEPISNAEHSRYWPDGTAAYCQGDLRRLPRYFKSENCGTAKAWLAGYDFAKSVDVRLACSPSIAEIYRREWTVSAAGTALYPLSVAAGDQVVMHFHSWDTSKEANARFIVKVLNRHAQTLDFFHSIAAITVDERPRSLEDYEALRYEARALLR